MSKQRAAAPRVARSPRAEIWDWDLTAGRVDWSPRLAKLCGTAPGTRTGNHRALLRCVHPEDRREFARRLGRAWRECDGFEHEFRVIHPDGATRWIVAVGKFLCGRGGKAARMIGTVLDVTARKRIEEEAQVRHAEIAHLARLSVVGQMAAGIAHELTQPFTAILNFANAATLHLRAGDAAAAMDGLREVVRETVRATDVVARVRAFGRKSPAVRVPTDVNAAVHDAIGLLRYRLRHHNVRAELRLRRRLPPVTADPVEIQQVLVNLIQNGIDAMRHNRHVRPTLVIRTSHQAPAGPVVVRISDSGEGTPDGDPDDWFRPFFTTKDEGLGLGLSISRSIVEHHGGELRAHRNPDHGSTFELALPTGPGGDR